MKEMKKYYVFACNWMGADEEDMKEHLDEADVFDNFEEAEKKYNYYVEEELEPDETCYIFDGGKILKEWQ